MDAAARTAHDSTLQPFSEMEHYKHADELPPEIMADSYDKLERLCLKYMNEDDFSKVEQAYCFAAEKHCNQKRRSGEMYINHPVEVAIILADLKMDCDVVCAALLHDTVEDTETSLADVSGLFGDTVAELVDGVTKLTNIEVDSMDEKQALTLRKMFLAMSKDIRVIIVKLADRLHNMRTLGSMLPSKQYKIAGETLYIYAPLAHRLGLFAIKTELEDLAFKYEHPEAYNQIKQKIAETEESRQQIYNNFSKPIVAKLKEMGLEFEMKARVKSIYSIWNKMESKHIPFEEVYDLYAVRIIFKCPNEADEKKECWAIYSVITDIYKLHPERTRDWVSRPKANGYKALHLTVMGPDGNWIEVQIRSEKMDEIAERGFAAHWKYKVGNSDEESELDIWLKTIKDILEHPEPNAIDFLDTIKLNLFSTEIFVFTPKGELITLPKDATALDLAFTLHSDLGFHCIAAKVNHRLVPLNQKLHSGDQVEILTSKSQTPKEEWLNFITTAKARSRLTASLRKDRRKIIAKGEKILKEFFESSHIEYNNDVVTKILSNLGIRHRDDLFYKIGNDEITPNENIKKIIKGKSQNPFMRYLKLSFGSNNGKNEQPKPVTPQQLTIDRKQTYILRDENGVKNYKVADCCCPIPGDDVLGYVEDDETVVVHKRECPVAMRLKSSFGPRLVSTQWEASESLSFPAKIEIQGIDRIGILNEITRVISNELIIDMRGLTIKANEGVFTGTVNIMVHDTRVVESLCNKLRKIKGVQKVARCKE